MVRYFCILTSCLILAVSAAAQSRSSNLNPLLDARGAPELTVCSQNLENYGAYPDALARSPGLTDFDLQHKERDLITRFIHVGCDVIAVQEVLGKGEEKALIALSRLAELLRKASGRIYEVKTGPSNDPMSRVGFLVAKDRAEIINLVSYNNIELPKISEKQKPRDFSRGPLEIQLSVKGQADAQAKTVSIVNIHFKSKHGAQEDAAELDWETYRMEMAEAVRRIVDNRHSKDFKRGDSILMVVGDRNSNFDVASAKILNGILKLKNFQGTAPCRLSKRGVPLCQANIAQPARLFSVLLEDPQTKVLPGTFLYNKEYSWLDDILMPFESMRFAWAKYDSAGDYDCGVLNEPKDASDHAMVWVRLNW